jgi:N-acetylmuramic acid 6-phosphate etherase
MEAIEPDKIRIFVDEKKPGGNLEGNRPLPFCHERLARAYDAHVSVPVGDELLVEAVAQFAAAVVGHVVKTTGFGMKPLRQRRKATDDIDKDVLAPGIAKRGKQALKQVPRTAFDEENGIHGRIPAGEDVSHYPEYSVLEKLLTEQPNPVSARIDEMTSIEALRIINAEDRTVAEAVEKVIPAIARAVESIVEAFRRGGRLFYIGAGTSGRLGVLDAAECPPTFGVPKEMIQGIIAGGELALLGPTEASEDDAAAGALDLEARGFTAADVLVGITASGRTPYVLGAVAAARAIGAVTAGISCTPDSELARAVDIAITPLTGPEVLAGSTRMKAGTAQKLVLNMLSTGAFLRMGYVYGNLMVNVEPANAKLADRATRIVAQAANVSYEQARESLAAAGDSVRVAIVMLKTGVARGEAERRLEAAGGSIARALA